MFLLPQHFQQQEQYQSEQFGISSWIDHPNCYGFRDLAFNDAAFANWELGIDRAAGRCKDGTQFDFSAGEIPRVDLRTVDDGKIEDALRRGEPVTAYLAISHIKPNEHNISRNGQQARFHEFESEVFDFRTGDRHEKIVLKKIVASVVFNCEKTSEFEFLPLAHLQLVDSAQGQIPQVGDSMVPPSTVSRSNPQALRFWERNEDRLSGYLRTLVDYLDAEEIGVVGLGASEFSENVFRFLHLNELRAWMITHNRGQGLHPFACYQFLSQIVGRLAIADPNRNLLPDFPVYNHDDPLRSWEWAWTAIRRHFVNPGESRVRRIPLLAEQMQTESGIEVVSKAHGLKAEYFDTDRWAIYMGIYFGEMDKNDAKLFFRNYLMDGRLFYWKMGDENHINEFFTKRIKGVNFDNIEKRKPHLEPKKSWFFYDIAQDEYWDEVRSTRTLCLRIDQENLATKNSDLGAEDITVMIEDRGVKKSYRFRVSLWAVDLQ